MLRGVITITKEESDEALDWVHKYLADTPLESKLIAATGHNQDEIELQLSEQEVEQLLDNMDAPSPEDSAAKKNLRKALQTFMVKLKGV